MGHVRDDRRAAERYSYGKTLSYNALGIAGKSPGAIPVKVQSVDLGGGGMKIRIVGRLISQGSIIQVNIPVARLNISLPVLTEVRWVAQQSPDIYHVGLRFLLQ